MKTMRFLALAAAVTALAGCSKQEPAKIGNPDTGHEVYLAVRASSADTRTAISPDYDIRWTGGDAIGLFYNVDEIKAEQKVFGSTNFNGELQNIKYGIVSGHGSTAAAFACEQDDEHEHPYFPYTGNFQWQGESSQTTLYAYSPYYYDPACSSAYNVKYVPFHLPASQTGSLDGVAANDLAYASATVMRGDGDVVRGEADFRFRHLFSILEITVENSLADAVTVESVTVSAAADKALTGDCTVDLTTGAVTMGQSANQSGTMAGASQPSVMLKPEKGVALQPQAATTLYAVVAPCDLAGAAVRVTTSAGYQDFSVSGIAAEAGKYYRKSVALSNLNPVADVHTIDFEDVQLGTESQDGSVAQTYYNVLSALGADRSGWEMDDYGLAQIGTMYTADGVNFNGFYYDEGGYYKTWGGFGFSSNVSSEFSMTTDFAYQFHAMTADGGDNKFSVVYDFASGLFGPGYESAVDFPFAVNPVAVDVTNTPMMGAHMGENPAVKFVGYLSEEKRGEVAFSLVDVKEWTEVDLSPLGRVDRVEVVMSGKPSSTPFYVCLDNLKYTKAE